MVSRKKSNLQRKTLTVNEFINLMKKEFNAKDFKAVAKDGTVYKTKGWKDEI